MIEVKDNSVTVAKYAYDPMGRRIWRQAGSDITWFLYSDEGLIEELTAANTAIRTYGWNPGGMWGTDTVWQKDANGVFMSNNDHLYTTDVLTSGLNGNKSWAGVWESFGIMPKFSRLKNAKTRHSMLRPWFQPFTIDWPLLINVFLKVGAQERERPQRARSLRWAISWLQ